MKDIIRRDCARVTLEGDSKAVLKVANLMAKYFHFDNEEAYIRYSKQNTAKFGGTVDGKRLKKYRKHACVDLYDVTDYETDNDE